jgi:hypothetical protein
MWNPVGVLGLQIFAHHCPLGALEKGQLLCGPFCMFRASLVAKLVIVASTMRAHRERSYGWASDLKQREDDASKAADAEDGKDCSFHNITISKRRIAGPPQACRWRGW